MEFSQEEIQRKYNLLSPRLKEEMNSIKEVDSLTEICEENKIDNFLEIQENISFLILGLINFDDFKTNILSIVGELGQQVYQQIFNTILLPILPLLQNRKEETTITKIQEAKKMNSVERQKKATEYNGKDTYREKI